MEEGQQQGVMRRMISGRGVGREGVGRARWWVGERLVQVQSISRFYFMFLFHPHVIQVLFHAHKFYNSWPFHISQFQFTVSVQHLSSNRSAPCRTAAQCAMLSMLVSLLVGCVYVMCIWWIWMVFRHNSIRSYSFTVHCVDPNASFPDRNKAYFTVIRYVRVRQTDFSTCGLVSIRMFDFVSETKHILQ